MNALLKKVSVLFFSFALLGGIAQAAEEEVPATVAGTSLINAEGIIDLVQKAKGVVLIDSRKPSDHEKGFIEGSVGLPDTDTNPASLAKVAPNKAAPVVFWCNGIHCHRSMHAAKVAVDAGYTKVYWYRAGWEEWLAKGFPVAK